MTTLGAVYVPQLQTERLRSVARVADEAGLEQLWLWEDCFLASGVALDWPPLGPAPVLSGATGPRSMRLSGELAAGTILTGGTSPEGVRAARLLLDEGRAAAGRTGTQPVTVYVVAANGQGCGRGSWPSRRGSVTTCLREQAWLATRRW